MELIVIGSSSSGNCYILKGNHEALIIECGLPAKLAMDALEFNHGSIAGAIVSHKHGDHAAYVGQYLDKVIDVYANDNYEGKNGRKSLSFEHGIPFKVGGFQIKPLEVEHDVKCFSFMIYHPECGMVYFVTDTHFIKYNPKGVNHMIVESNYSEKLMESNINNGEINLMVRNRVLENHLSVENLIKWLEVVDLSNTTNIVLTHLSGTNSGEDFQHMVESATGKTTNIAVPGLVVPLNKRPF